MRTAIVTMMGVLCAAGAAAQTAAPQLANPASLHCVQQGGTPSIERRPDGGQFGVCVFADNFQCEEWALLRGHCPKGGLRVTGYATPAGRYCAITGGRYAVVPTPSSAGEQGVCSLPGGSACSAESYWAGACPR